jgi:hypothetical protein
MCRHRRHYSRSPASTATSRVTRSRSRAVTAPSTHAARPSPYRIPSRLRWLKVPSYLRPMTRRCGAPPRARRGCLTRDLVGAPVGRHGVGRPCTAPARAHSPDGQSPGPLHRQLPPAPQRFGVIGPAANAASTACTAPGPTMHPENGGIGPYGRLGARPVRLNGGGRQPARPSSSCSNREYQGRSARVPRPIGSRCERAHDCQPILRAKYGFHTMRHFFASWLLAEGLRRRRACSAMPPWR